MVNCDICKDKIAELYLSKLKGTVIYKEGSKKKYHVCFTCQKTFKNKEELLAKL